MKTPLEIAVHLGHGLHAASFPYAIGGALAYSYWGVARATHDTEVTILSAEDLITLKMLFFRAKDLMDVERVVALRGPDLDRDYVRRWLLDSVGADDPRMTAWAQICARNTLEAESP